MPPFGSIQLILEGVGAMLAMVGLGGSAGITIGVLLRRAPEDIGSLGHAGTALGFILGIPAAILFVLLSK
jgi:hypothetical protein